MHMIDIVLMGLYCTVIICSSYIILCHKTYFHEHFQKGVYSWTLAQLGTTNGIIALAILTYTGKYDEFIHLKAIHREGGGHTDPDSD